MNQLPISALGSAQSFASVVHLGYPFSRLLKHPDAILGKDERQATSFFTTGAFTSILNLAACALRRVLTLISNSY